jgi:hypothetical protein
MGTLVIAAVSRGSLVIIITFACSVMATTVVTMMFVFTLIGYRE